MQDAGTMQILVQVPPLHATEILLASSGHVASIWCTCRLHVASPPPKKKSHPNTQIEKRKASNGSLNLPEAA